MTRRTITTEEFDEYLGKVLDGMTGRQVAALPGVVEIAMEELNNEVIALWESDNWGELDEDEDEDEDDETDDDE